MSDLACLKAWGRNFLPWCAVFSWLLFFISCQGGGAGKGGFPSGASRSDSPDGQVSPELSSPGALSQTPPYPASTFPLLPASSFSIEDQTLTITLSLESNQLQFEDRLKINVYSLPGGASASPPSLFFFLHRYALISDFSVETPFGEFLEQPVPFEEEENFSSLFPAQKKSSAWPEIASSLKLIRFSPFVREKDGSVPTRKGEDSKSYEQTFYITIHYSLALDLISDGRFSETNFFVLTPDRGFFPMVFSSPGRLDIAMTMPVDFSIVSPVSQAAFMVQGRKKIYKLSFSSGTSRQPLVLAVSRWKKPFSFLAGRTLVLIYPRKKIQKEFDLHAVQKQLAMIFDYIDEFYPYAVKKMVVVEIPSGLYKAAYPGMVLLDSSLLDRMSEGLFSAQGMSLIMAGVLRQDFSSRSLGLEEPGGTGQGKRKVGEMDSSWFAPASREGWEGLADFLTDIYVTQLQGYTSLAKVRYKKLTVYAMLLRQRELFLRSSSGEGLALQHLQYDIEDIQYEFFYLYLFGIWKTVHPLSDLSVFMSRVKSFFQQNSSGANFSGRVSPSDSSRSAGSILARHFFSYFIKPLQSFKPASSGGLPTSIQGLKNMEALGKSWFSFFGHDALEFDVVARQSFIPAPPPRGIIPPSNKSRRGNPALKVGPLTLFLVHGLSVRRRYLSFDLLLQYKDGTLERRTISFAQGKAMYDHIQMTLPVKKEVDSVIFDPDGRLLRNMAPRFWIPTLGALLLQPSPVLVFDRSQGTGWMRFFPLFDTLETMTHPTVSFLNHASWNSASLSTLDDALGVNVSEKKWKAWFHAVHGVLSGPAQKRFMKKMSETFSKDYEGFVTFSLNSRSEHYRVGFYMNTLAKPPSSGSLPTSSMGGSLLALVHTAFWYSYALRNKAGKIVLGDFSDPELMKIFVRH